MNKIVKDFVHYIVSLDCPQNHKAKVKKEIQDKFSLILDRSVFYCDSFAVRISYTKTTSYLCIFAKMIFIICRVLDMNFLHYKFS